LIYEEFVADPVSACRRIFEQLGVDAAFVPDTSVAHNAHLGVRSQVAASGLRWLRRPTNPIRRTARRLLHPRKFTRLGERLLQANRGLYSAETVDPEAAAALAD